MMFRFIIRGKNCVNYIDECFNSLNRQTIKDWYALVLLDPSKDGSKEKILEWVTIQPKISVIANTEQFGVCRNMYQGLHYIGIENIRKPEDNDIVVILDLDDFLYRDTSLEIVKKYYDENPEIMATYGSFRFKDKEKSSLCKPFEGSEPRKERWRFSHLKTFKYSVIKHIPQEYFMHNGEWGEGASDLALMFCVAEIVGVKRCKFVKESVYYYRNNTSNSLNRKKQKEWNKIWRQKIPLKKQF